MVVHHGALSPTDLGRIEMAASLVCRIDGCNNPIRNEKRLLCARHYQKLRRHGDPEHPDRGAKATQFYETFVLLSAQDDCIIWPFTKLRGGYASMSVNGVNRVVSRLACEAIHGSPPTASHEAAHTCGNGHLACVNPRHLAWKTPKENSADRLVHKTLLPDVRKRRAFVRSGRKKLTAQQTEAIAASAGLQRELAQQYGVCVQTIRKVRRGTY